MAVVREREASPVSANHFSLQRILSDSADRLGVGFRVYLLDPKETVTFQGPVIGEIGLRNNHFSYYELSKPRKVFGVPLQFFRITLAGVFHFPEETNTFGNTQEVLPECIYVHTPRVDDPQTFLFREVLRSSLEGFTEELVE